MDKSNCPLIISMNSNLEGEETGLEAVKTFAYFCNEI